MNAGEIFRFDPFQRAYDLIMTRFRSCNEDFIQIQGKFWIIAAGIMMAGRSMAARIQRVPATILSGMIVAADFKWTVMMVVGY